jgi:hypothetical protein
MTKTLKRYRKQRFLVCIAIRIYISISRIRITEVNLHKYWTGYCVSPGLARVSTVLQYEAVIQHWTLCRCRLHWTNWSIQMSRSAAFSRSQQTQMHQRILLTDVFVFRTKASPAGKLHSHFKLHLLSTLLYFLLSVTNYTDQRLSLEESSHSHAKEITYRLWNLKVPYNAHSSSPGALILNRTGSTHLRVSFQHCPLI